jgi:uncharacterized protein
MTLQEFTMQSKLRHTGKLRLATAALLFSPVLWMSGCAATSTFTSHPARIDPFLGALQSGKPIDLGSSLLPECSSKDGILYDMERGRLAQILGQGESSRQDFSAASERIRQNDEKARISLSGIGANVAAIAVNDNAVPYQGAGYERVMLHHYQALNYLHSNDLEGAGVEVRRANAEQEEALKLHQEELERARQQAEDNRVADLASNPAISAAYAGMDEVAGKVGNSFQNAYTFYLSAFIYEALHEPNDAYIDYRKALEIYPGNRFLRRDVLRLAKELGISDPPDGAEPPIPPAPPGVRGGDLLVLFEDGFVPRKTQVKIPLPIPKLGLLAVAFPVYQATWSPPPPLTVEADGDPIGATEPICDFRALAVKALQEEVPVIATRQLVRLVAKGATAELAREKLGLLGELGISLWNVVGENADLRSWISLPANAQVLRAALPPGTHRLAIRPAGEGAPVTVEVKVSEGSRSILHVIRAGRKLYTTVIPLGGAERRASGAAGEVPS